VWLVSGQVGHLLPDALTEAIAGPEAMMQMGKIDIAAIEAARSG
jgi:predicted 3-demethylubiquinone-9 3-methyltransferase (glyoxalase superfamily)